MHLLLLATLHLSAMAVHVSAEFGWCRGGGRCAGGDGDEDLLNHHLDDFRCGGDIGGAQN